MIDETKFLSVKTRFDRVLTNGQRAEIRRAGAPDDLALLPGYYWAIAGENPCEGWRRVCFLLPYAKHSPGGARLGRLLAAGGVSEMRLFQMLRADSPRDILHLRRLCRHIEPALDWKIFGRMLYYWKPGDKQKIAEDYYNQEQRPRKAREPLAEAPDAG